MNIQTCPQCSSLKVIFYHYGYTEQSPKMIAMELGYFKVEVTGCMPENELYDHECYDCKHKWWAEDINEDNDFITSKSSKFIKFLTENKKKKNFKIRKSKLQRLGDFSKKRFTEFEKILDLELSRVYGKELYEREFVIGRYRLDFFFSTIRLGIEVDGSYHHKEKQKEIDEEKTMFCNQMDIKIIRFSNHQVKTQIKWVLSQIDLQFKSRKKLW